MFGFADQGGVDGFREPENHGAVGAGRRGGEGAVGLFVTLLELLPQVVERFPFGGFVAEVLIGIRRQEQADWISSRQV